MNDVSHVVAVPYLIETLSFLLTVVIVVPVCKRFKVSPIIGFLAVGALIGPYALGLVKDVVTVQHVAELGVIFLLFTIGLELSFERLAAFSKHIFGMGSLHFILCASAIGICAYTWDNSVESSIILGCCLALSSTAVVIQLLNERNEMATTHGRATFSVLLFQDLMVVPILILVTIFGQDSEGNVTSIVLFSLIKAIIAIAAIIFIGRYVLRYLFKIAAKTHAVEVFMAATLLAILVTATLTGISGLSMALGAFLAGLLLAETQYRHQIETDIEPFKGIFLGLFFTGVGMNIDFVLAFERGYWVLLSVFGLITIKAICGFIVALIFKLNVGNALRKGLLLAEAGEFAFLVIGQASLNYQIVDIAVAQFMVVVAGLSMVLTPILAWAGAYIAKNLGASEIQENHFKPDNEEDHDHVVIAGFGRVGQAIAKVLNQQSIPYVALDTNAQEVKGHHKHASQPVFHGDASNPELLRKTGISNAKAAILTMDNPAAALRSVRVIREHWPDLPVIVRAKNDEHSDELIEAGATQVVPEIYETSLQLVGHVLRGCNYTREEADACIELVRRHNYEEVHAD